MLDQNDSPIAIVSGNFLHLIIRRADYDPGTTVGALVDEYLYPDFDLREEFPGLAPLVNTCNEVRARLREYSNMNLSDYLQLLDGTFEPDPILQ
tara:strand:- start:272 stop:553 length:282 start_codon:yes stop_codon:yes gene_type:complete